MLLVERAKIIGVNPGSSNMANTAMTAKYVSLKNYNHLTIIIHSGAWAGGTAAVSLLQATDVSASGAQALEFDYQWTGTVASGLLTRTAVTSDTFNISVANTLHVIEIDADSLDRDDNFDCVTLVVATPGANNDYYNVDYILSEPRYTSDVPESAIID